MPRRGILLAKTLSKRRETQEFTGDIQKLYSAKNQTHLCKALTYHSLHKAQPNCAPIAISGDKIVGRYRDENDKLHGCLYDGTSWTTLDHPSATSGTAAYGVDGSKIVGFYNLSGPLHGFLYDGTKPVGSQWSTIDRSGASQTTVIGIDGGKMVGTVWSSGTSNGYIYDGTTWTILPQPTGSISVGASDISGSNVVGQYNVDSPAKHQGYLYDGTTATPHNFPGSYHSITLGIDGDNIVGFYTENNVGGIHGFLFDGFNWTTLDFPGATRTFAYGIDGDNIVGYYNDVSGTRHGFLLTLNNSPVANAGEDQELYAGSNGNKMVTLNGSGSTDADSTTGTNDDIDYFDWYDDAGFWLGGGETLDVSFERGLHTITLEVIDSSQESGTDEVVIRINNNPPVADAGEDQEVAVGDEVYLNGSNSSDPDSDELTFTWDFIEPMPDDSASVLVVDYDPAMPSFEADVLGSYNISLVASDAEASSVPDVVTVIAIAPEKMIEKTLKDAAKILEGIPAEDLDNPRAAHNMTKAISKVIDSVNKPKKPKYQSAH